jgi:CRP-like cAMP-binding protein
MYEKYMDKIQKASLFADINRPELISMLNCLKPKILRYNKNDYITTAGQVFDSVGIIVEGEAIISKDNAAGDRAVMNIVRPGDMFGEMVVFSKQSKWPATVQAKEACTVFFLSKGKIIGECEKTCQWHKTLIQNMLKIISERALMLNKKLEYLTIKSMRGRLCTYFLEQYKMSGSVTFSMPLKRNELADFLNVSRPSMSREMGRMRDEGIIDFYLATIKILDIEGLKNSCV